MLCDKRRSKLRLLAAAEPGIQGSPIGIVSTPKASYRRGTVKSSTSNLETPQIRCRGNDFPDISVDVVSSKLGSTLVKCARSNDMEGIGIVVRIPTVLGQVATCHWNTVFETVFVAERIHAVAHLSVPTIAPYIHGTVRPATPEIPLLWCAKTLARSLARRRKQG